MSRIITAEQIREQGAQDNIITEARVIPVSVKRLQTSDGLGRALPHVRIGDEYLVDLNSVAYVRIDYPNGKFHDVTIIHKVDVNGVDQGWIYAEFFFSSSR